MSTFATSGSVLSALECIVTRVIRNGWSALRFAVEYHQAACLGALLKMKADVNARTRCECSAACRSCKIAAKDRVKGLCCWYRCFCWLLLLLLMLLLLLLVMKIDYHVLMMSYDESYDFDDDRTAAAKDHADDIEHVLLCSFMLG